MMAFNATKRNERNTKNMIEKPNLNYALLHQGFGF